MLAAISENPISGQTRPRPARKKSSPVLPFRLLYMLTPMTTAKKTTKTVMSAQCRFMDGSLGGRGWPEMASGRRDATPDPIISGAPGLATARFGIE
jgi:hypothetical protein